MKNIHTLPTEKPSRLKQNKITKKISLVNKGIDLTSYTPINIFITSDEEIKDGDWIYYTSAIGYCKTTVGSKGLEQEGIPAKKIILTTDQDLIKDGVPAIDDDFLEWFVQNPSCEWVEVKKGKMKLNDDGEEYGFPDMSLYKIIIPKEEIINCEHCGGDGVYITDCEKIKGLFDMTIDGFDYHFISKKYDTKEEIEEQLKWFSDWMKRLRNKM